jgi:hypothetical protein
MDARQRYGGCSPGVGGRRDQVQRLGVNRYSLEIDNFSILKKGVDLREAFGRFDVPSQPIGHEDGVFSVPDALLHWAIPISHRNRECVVLPAGGQAGANGGPKDPTTRTARLETQMQQGCL